MPKITGSWELRHILQATDIEALERVHEELGRRISTLRRLAERKGLAHGDVVSFERNGQTVVGTLYRRAAQEAWVKGDDGTVYLASIRDLTPAGTRVHPLGRAAGRRAGGSLLGPL